ncbi:hypothetical protein D3C71_1343120 [compost metagenome]
MLARQRRAGYRQRHDVLQLVAKTVGTARLVVAAARPQPAGKRLIEQPAIGQRVHGQVRGLDAHDAQRLPPVPPDGLEFAAGRPQFAVSAHQLPDVLDALRRGAKVEQDSDVLSILQRGGDLDGGAGVQPRARSAGQPAATHGLGVAQGAVPADELLAVAGHGPRRAACVEPSDVPGEIRIEAVAGQ